MGESALLQGGKKVFGGSTQVKLAKLTAGLIIGAAAWQQLQNFTPLDDNFLTAIEESGKHISIALALGAAAGLAGGGRLRGSTDEMSKSAQVLLDSFTAV